MNNQSVFSIIIPHKNIPDLLQRCLDSIPRRDDIQIIVVDDNSDPAIVDFENFPGRKDPLVEVYFTKKGKGAGYARNIGLNHAVGKWVLFADADDVFLDNIGDYLERCRNVECEVIIFNYVSKRLNGELRYPESINTDNPKIVFPQKCFPWCKIIKKALLDKYEIRFQEVQWSNDLMFSVKLAKYVNVVSVDKERAYMQIERYGSLCKKVSWQSLCCRTRIALKAYHFMKGYPESKCLKSLYMIYWKDLFHINKICASLMIPRILFVIGLKDAYNDILQRLRIDYPKYFK